MEESSAQKPGSSIWPTTDWSGVGHAATALGKDPDRLNHLILTYRVPLRVYLLSTFPSLKSEAEEILQDFAQDKILKEGWLGRADRSRGRFRSFLKSSLKNFVKDRLRAKASRPASLEELEVDLPAESNGTELFDLNWARVIVAEVLRRMEEDCRSPGKDQPRRTHIWELFQLRFLKPVLEDETPANYEVLVRRFNLTSPFDAQNMLATAKRIFERHFRGVIAEYEQGERAIKAEIEDFRQTLLVLSKNKRGRTAQD
jgi:DNA-directed RNA polymerase specialized sigma24 family protein